MRPGWILSLLVVLFAPAAFPQDEGKKDDPLEAHIRLHREVAPAVVYVRCGCRCGSGFFIDRKGIVVTTSTAIGRGGITVQTSAHKRFKAVLVGTSSKLELAVLKVDVEDHPALELGDSDGARLGQVVYTLGDSFGSLQTDDQVAISVGILSGKYELEKRKRRGTYVGPVLETSAAVNQNQDGGPMVDARGRVLGMITLNYDDSKFTGVAIPVNRLRPAIGRILRGEKEPEEKPPVRASGKKGGWFGLRVREVRNGLEVMRVSPKGPAAKAGLKSGDVLTNVGARKVLRAATFKEVEGSFAPGEKAKVRFLREGKAMQRTLTVGKKRIY
ncbi:MAG: S1C family serine protease [Planctomycetota bacterium]|jgi:S1-C subfamily serine protease